MDYLLVDFRTVYGVHFDTLLDLIRKSTRRLRLLPPCREHLSQGFARFFMRVGLPVEIPPFAKTFFRGKMSGVRFPFKNVSKMK